MCVATLFDDTTGRRVQTHESSAPNTSFASQTSKGIWFVSLFIFERYRLALSSDYEFLQPQMGFVCGCSRADNGVYEYPVSQDRGVAQLPES